MNLLYCIDKHGMHPVLAKKKGDVYNIVCTPLLSAGVGSSLLPNFQKGGGGLAGPPFLEWGGWERGGDFFQEGCDFSAKKKLKSGIFNDKKSL